VRGELHRGGDRGHPRREHGASARTLSERSDPLAGCPARFEAAASNTLGEYSLLALRSADTRGAILFLILIRGWRAD
jgi:hypothetical protein